MQFFQNPGHVFSGSLECIASFQNFSALQDAFQHLLTCCSLPTFCTELSFRKKTFSLSLVFSLLQFLLTSADWAGHCTKNPWRAITWTWRFNPALKLAALHVCPWTDSKAISTCLVYTMRSCFTLLCWYTVLADNSTLCDRHSAAGLLLFPFVHMRSSGRAEEIWCHKF